MIEVSHLKKDFDGHHAVSDISFHVEKGEIMGLLGPNGAGKSTTMNILTGYISASSGEVKIGGYNIMEKPMNVKRMIGYLPEIPPLYEDMTVMEYLKFVCKLKGIHRKKEWEKVIEDIMDATKIAEQKTRLIRNLSKGYRQRVGLAQALIGNPEVLILDEPMVGMDPNQIIEIRSLIKSLAGKHTIILSSHILSEVNTICNRILIMDKGSIVAEDTTDNLSRHFSENNILTLSVKGEAEKVKEVLKGFELVERYEVLEQEKEIVSVRLYVKEKRDITDEVFYLFADARIPVIRIDQNNMSLEDVFMKLTGKDIDCIEAEAEIASEKLDGAKDKKKEFFFGRKKKKKKEDEKEEASL